MKWLILLFLVFLLVVFVSNRYRKQINSVIRFWKAIQNESPLTQQTKEISEEKTEMKDFNLVKCASCGTWMPQNIMLSVDSKKNVCSKECLNQLVKTKK